MAILTTPVRTQPAGDLRCISYAVAAAIETSICRNQGTSAGVPEVSTDDVFEEGGSEVGAIDGIVDAAPGGFVDVVCRPPGAAGRCPNPASNLWRSRIQAVAFQQKDRVAVMKQVLSSAGPIVLFMEVFANFPAFAGNGVYKPNGNSIGFHSVCILDHEDDPGGATGRWIAKNSMGALWGDQGFFRIEWRDKVLQPERVVFVVKDVHQ